MVVEHIDDYLSVIGNDYTKTNIKHSLHTFVIYCEEHGLFAKDFGLHQYKKYVKYLRDRDSSQPEIASRAYDAQAYMEWLGDEKNIYNPVHEYNNNLANDETIATKALEKYKIKADKTKLEELYPEEVQYLTVEEYEALLDNTDSLRMEIIYTLLWETGARPSEIHELNYGRIELQDRTISMLTKKNPNKDRRNVYISHKAKLKLERWVKGERFAFNPDDDGLDEFKKPVEERKPVPVLITKQGRMSKNNIGRLVREKSKGAELDGNSVQYDLYEDTKGDTRWRVNCQIFRRSYGTNRVKQGMDISILSKLMGHASIETTEKYLRFNDNTIKEFDDKYRPT